MSLLASPPIPTQSHFNHSSGLASDVHNALRNTGYSEIYNLDVIVDAHEVHLSGRVSSYYIRQRAENAALSIPGVITVTSNIVIASH